MDSVAARLDRDGIGIEEDRLRRIGPGHFSRIDFLGRFRFNVERYAGALLERVVGQGAAKPGQSGPWPCSWGRHVGNERVGRPSVARRSWPQVSGERSRTSISVYLALEDATRRR